MNGIHVELIELRKALEKAVVPAEKFRNDLLEANRKLHEQIWRQITQSMNSSPTSQRTSKSNSNGNGNSHSNGGIDFQIGSSVSHMSFKDRLGNGIFCFGEGDNIKTLIDDNENLRIR